MNEDIELLDALAWASYQGCCERPDGWISHVGLSAYTCGVRLLCVAGYAETHPTCDDLFKIHWDKLEDKAGLIK